MFAHLLAVQDESLTALQHLAPQGCGAHFLAFSPGPLSISQTIPGCQASIQLMSSLCTLAWVRGRARGALHHSQPAESCHTGVQNQPQT